MNRVLIVSLFLLLAVQFVNSTEARPILMDESHDQIVPLSSDVRYAGARAALMGDGHTLTVLGGAPGAITAAALAGFEVFYTGTIQADYTPAEIATLQAFVAGGGGLIVNHEGGFMADAHVASVNLLLAPYGVVLAPTTTFTNGVKVNGFEPQCLTEQVDTLGIDLVRELSSISAPSIDLTTGPLDVLSVFDDGSGWVIVVADYTLWVDPGNGGDFDIDDFDNLDLLLATFGYQTCRPTPVAPATWGGIKATFR